MVHVLGLEKNVVHLKPFHKAWPDIFKKEQNHLAGIMTNYPLRIEHIGSTSVEGLMAKPIIDIMIGVTDFSSLSEIIKQLTIYDYLYKGELGITDRHFFKKLKDGKTIFHLHLCLLHSSFWAEHLLFRDVLRNNEKIRNEYTELKISLAERYPEDREKYTESKGEFIMNVIKNFSPLKQD